MTNGGDAMLRETIDDAVQQTAHAPDDQTGLCRAHEPLRTGVHALLLCKQDEMRHPRPADPPRVLKLGKLEVSARGADLTKILLAVVIVVILAGERLPKWLGNVPDSQPVAAAAVAP